MTVHCQCVAETRWAGSQGPAYPGVGVPTRAARPSVDGMVAFLSAGNLLRCAGGLADCCDAYSMMANLRPADIIETVWNRLAQTNGLMDK